MSAAAITTLDLRVVESVLEMGGGYVLDFTNRTFSGFFREYGVDIDDGRFSVDGSSKANRLRCFLGSSRPPLTGRVLAGLLQHRLASKPLGMRREDFEKYRQLVARLGGEVSTDVSGTAGAYEPVWAIGTGKVATSAQVAEVHQELHKYLTAQGLTDFQLLYGGSVKPDNAFELLSIPHVDGFLIGGTSLQVEPFIKVCEQHI